MFEALRCSAGSAIHYSNRTDYGVFSLQALDEPSLVRKIEAGDRALHNNPVFPERVHRARGSLSTEGVMPLEHTEGHETRQG